MPLFLLQSPRRGHTLLVTPHSCSCSTSRLPGSPLEAAGLLHPSQRLTRCRSLPSPSSSSTRSCATQLSSRPTKRNPSFATSPYARAASYIRTGATSLKTSSSSIRLSEGCRPFSGSAPPFAGNWGESDESKALSYFRMAGTNDLSTSACSS